MKKSKINCKKIITSIIRNEEVGLDEIIENNKKPIRPSVLNLSKKVYITPEAYKILRAEKREQEKSMAQIVCDLILKEYKEPTD